MNVASKECALVFFFGVSISLNDRLRASTSDMIVKAEKPINRNILTEVKTDIYGHSQ